MSEEVAEGGPAAAPAKGKDREKQLSPLELKKGQRGKIGLTIKGKMDLAPKKPAPGKAAKGAPAPTAAATAAAAEAEDHKRKKKKKRVKDETPEVEAGGRLKILDKKKKKKKKLRHKEINQTEVDEAIRRTLAAMDDTRCQRTRGQQETEAEGT